MRGECKVPLQIVLKDAVVALGEDRGSKMSDRYVAERLR